jgi:hypothetical protein
MLENGAMMRIGLNILVRATLIQRLAFAIAGFMIYLCGAEMVYVFMDIFPVEILSWIFRATGFLLVLQFAVVLRGKMDVSTTTSSSKRNHFINETIDLEYSYRLDNWHHPDYWRSDVWREFDE